MAKELTFTRRGTLGLVAGAAVVSIPAAAIEAAAGDPIRPLIARWWLLWNEANTPGIADDERDALVGVMTDVEHTIVATPPATPQGAIEALEYLIKLHEEQYPIGSEDPELLTIQNIAGAAIKCIRNGGLGA